MMTPYRGRFVVSMAALVLTASGAFGSPAPCDTVAEVLPACLKLSQVTVANEPRDFDRGLLYTPIPRLSYCPIVYGRMESRTSAIFTARSVCQSGAKE